MVENNNINSTYALLFYLPFLTGAVISKESTIIYEICNRNMKTRRRLDEIKIRETAGKIAMG